MWHDVEINEINGLANVSVFNLYHKCGCQSEFGYHIGTDGRNYDLVQRYASGFDILCHDGDECSYELVEDEEGFYVELTNVSNDDEPEFWLTIEEFKIATGIDIMMVQRFA